MLGLPTEILPQFSSARMRLKVRQSFPRDIAEMKENAIGLCIRRRYHTTLSADSKNDEMSHTCKKAPPVLLAELVT